MCAVTSALAGVRPAGRGTDSKKSQQSSVDRAVSRRTKEVARLTSDSRRLTAFDAGVRRVTEPAGVVAVGCAGDHPVVHHLLTEVFQGPTRDAF